MTIGKRIVRALGPSGIARLGAMLIRVLGVTWRYTTVNEPAYRSEVTRGRSVVLVLWHGTMLPLLYFHRGRRIAILISEHGDGEIIARVAERFGLSLVRGSTSRGGARALVGARPKVAVGIRCRHDTRWPPQAARCRSRPSALVAAYRNDAPVVPLTVTVNRAWRLRTWDQFLIPKPFARITIAYGNPTLVIANSPRQAASDPEGLRAQMDEAERATRPA